MGKKEDGLAQHQGASMLICSLIPSTKITFGYNYVLNIDIPVTAATNQLIAM